MSKRKFLTASAASLAVFGLLAINSAPAWAISYSGSQSCTSDKRVYLESWLTTFGTGTANTVTTHQHTYDGTTRTTNFVGFGLKTSYPNLSSKSSWVVQTSSPASAVLKDGYPVDGCAKKPV
ncbi:MAG: hypothetical protein LBK95_02550 [Bifidobacteriaceae bacterium]|jgi:hypothetical protein|nr:hypothetical protein [Bifidobacteriaceae bacterium]